MSSPAGHQSLARAVSQTPSSPAHSASNAPATSPTARQSSLVARVVSRMTSRARHSSSGTPTHTPKATPKATPNATPSHSRTLAPSSFNASSAVPAHPTTEATSGAYPSSGGSSQPHAAAPSRRRMPKQPAPMHPLQPPPDPESPTASPSHSLQPTPSAQAPMKPPPTAVDVMPQPALGPIPSGQPGDSSNFALPPHCPSPGPRPTPPKRTPSVLTATTRDISTTQEFSDTISVPLRPPAHGYTHATGAPQVEQHGRMPSPPLAAIPPSSSCESDTSSNSSNHYTPADPPVGPPRSQSPGLRREPPRPRSLLVPVEQIERTASPPLDTFVHFQAPTASESPNIPPRPHSPAPAIVHRSRSPPLSYPGLTRAPTSATQPQTQQMQPSPFGDFDAPVMSPAYAYAAFDQRAVASHDGVLVRVAHASGQPGMMPSRPMHLPGSAESYRSSRMSAESYAHRMSAGPVRYRSGPQRLPAFAAHAGSGDARLTPPPPEPQQTAAEAAAAGGGGGCSAPLPNNSQLRTHAAIAGGGMAGHHPDSSDGGAATAAPKVEPKAAKSFYQPVGFATIGGSDAAAAEAAAMAATAAVRANALAQRHLVGAMAASRPTSLYSKNLVANANITPDAYTTLPASFDMLMPPPAAPPASLRPAKAASVTYRQRGFTTLPVGAGLYSSLNAGTAEKAILWRNTGPAPLSVGAVAIGAPGGSQLPNPTSLCRWPYLQDQGPAHGHHMQPPPPPTSVPILYRSPSHLSRAAAAAVLAPRTLAGTSERRLLGAAARMHGERNTPEPPRSAEVSAYTSGAFLTMRERIAAMHGVRSQQSLYTSATPRAATPRAATQGSPPAQRPRTGHSEGAAAVSAAGSFDMSRHPSAPAQQSPSAAATPARFLPSPLSSGHASSRVGEYGRSVITVAGERGSGSATPSRMRALPYGSTSPAAARTSVGGADRRVMRRRTTAMLAATSNADPVSKAAHEAAAAALAEEQRVAAMFGTAGSKRRLHVSGGDSMPAEVYSGTAAPGSALAAVASGLDGSSTLGSNSSTLSRREAAFAVVMGRASNVFAGAGGVMEHRVVGSPAASIDRCGPDAGLSQHGEADGRGGGERVVQGKDLKPPGMERLESQGDDGSISSPFADAPVDGGRLSMQLVEVHGHWLEDE